MYMISLPIYCDSSCVAMSTISTYKGVAYTVIGRTGLQTIELKGVAYIVICRTGLPTIELNYPRIPEIPFVLLN